MGYIVCNCLQMPKPLNVNQPALTNQSRLKYLVGMRGFEPPTPSSRTKCATGLRYIPNKLCIIVSGGCFDKRL